MFQEGCFQKTAILHNVVSLLVEVNQMVQWHLHIEELAVIASLQIFSTSHLTHILSKGLPCPLQFPPQLSSPVFGSLPTLAASHILQRFPGYLHMSNNWYHNTEFIAQIYVLLKEKNFQLKPDVSVQHEGGYTIILGNCMAILHTL